MTWQSERDALLQRIVGALQSDQRVHAAWLEGSMGRGEPDAWSDIDIAIVVKDSAMEEVARAPLQFVHAITPTLMEIHVPQNAPPGGAYLFSLIDAPAGPQQVDWYWRPQSTARRPPSTKLFFAHSPVPAADPPTPLTDAERKIHLEAAIRECLAMASITARRVNRADAWAVSGHFQVLADCIALAIWFATHNVEPGYEERRRWKLTGDPPLTASAQNDQICEMLAGIEEIIAANTPDLMTAYQRIFAWVSPADTLPKPDSES